MADKRQWSWMGQRLWPAAAKRTWRAGLWCLLLTHLLQHSSISLLEMILARYRKMSWMRSLLLTVQHNEQRILQNIFAPIDIFIYNEDHCYEHLRIACSLFCNAVFWCDFQTFQTWTISQSNCCIKIWTSIHPSIFLEPLIEDQWCWCFTNQFLAHMAFR